MNSIRTSGIALCFALSFAAISTPASGQCVTPTPGLHAGGLVPRASSLVTFDDGSGPSLFATVNLGGTADTIVTTSLVKWDGAQWMNIGVPQTIQAIAVFDDGNGALLYISRLPFPTSQLVTWNGTSVVPLADQPNGVVDWLGVLDLGGGPELYACGTFSQIGSVPAPGIARFDGTTWTGVGPGGVDGPLEVYDDGGGAKLYGVVPDPPSPACEKHIVRLEGGSWTNVGVIDMPGVCVRVEDLHAHDDGGGAKLYVCGLFSLAGGASVEDVARWDGASWSAFGAPVVSSGGLSQLLTYDDGSGSALYVIGEILGSGATVTTGILRWDGSAWHAVGSGLGTRRFYGASGTGTDTDAVFALAVHDEGSGPRLFAAGTFENAGSVSAFGIARWNGATWSAVGNAGQGIGEVLCLKYGDEGSGPALYAGGDFTGAGTVAANHVARWDGTSWSALGEGVFADVRDMEIYDFGAGADLYVAGDFNQAGTVAAKGVARWDGTQWSVVGTGMGPIVYDLQLYDGGLGERLYAGVQFGGPHLYSWNGTGWLPISPGTNGAILALAAFGADLYMTGTFTSAGGVPAPSLARWNPTTGWSTVGTQGFPGGGIDLVVHDDGTGSALYVVGDNGDIKRWSGTSWSTLPSPSSQARTLESLDVGFGRPSLVATTSSEPERWTGTGWVPLTNAVVDGAVNAIASAPDPNGCAPTLYFAGEFRRYGVPVSTHFVELNPCSVGTAFCFGDGSLATPCPCVPPNTVPNPSGAPGHGCANSFHLEGAKMCAVGTTNPDTVMLRVTGLTPIGFTQFFKGNAQSSAGVAFADGVRCVDGTIFRFGGQNAVLGTAYYPNPSLGLVTPISNGGTPPGSGAVGYYQAIYRNATPNFCTIDTLNITNAVEIVWN